MVFSPRVTEPVRESAFDFWKQQKCKSLKQFRWDELHSAAAKNASTATFKYSHFWKIILSNIITGISTISCFLCTKCKYLSGYVSTWTLFICCWWNISLPVLKEPTFPVCPGGCECGGTSRRCRTIRRPSSSRLHTWILHLLRETSAPLHPQTVTRAQVSHQLSRLKKAHTTSPLQKVKRALISWINTWAMCSLLWKSSPFNLLKTHCINPSKSRWWVKSICKKKSVYTCRHTVMATNERLNYHEQLPRQTWGGDFIVKWLIKLYCTVCST